MAARTWVDFRGTAVSTYECPWNEWPAVEDMRKFVLNYGTYTSQQRGVSKHVNIVSELSRRVEERGLMETSQVATFRRA